MLGITSFNPIKTINSLIQPLGFVVSNKQQIIHKIALASLAMLAINHAFSGVEGGKDLDRCIQACAEDMDCIADCYIMYGSNTIFKNALDLVYCN